MAKKTSERVMEMVRAELSRNPDLSSSELYEMAKKLDRSIRSLTLRQFHAQYPLQVKRAKSLRRRGGRKAAAKKGGGRKRAAGGGGKKATKKRAKKSRRTKGRKRAAGVRGPAKRARRGRPAQSAAAPAAAAVPAAAKREGVQTVLLEFAAAVASADKADVVRLMLGMDDWVDRVVAATR